MTETSVTSTAAQLGQARHVLNYVINPYEEASSNQLVYNQPVYYPNMNQNMMHFPNQPNAFNNPQYIHNHLVHPHSQLLYQAPHQYQTLASNNKILQLVYILIMKRSRIAHPQ